MKSPKEELKAKIERARERLNKSIDFRESYETIYKNSVELDHLIELYLVAEN